ncbi:UPF0104 family protein [Candidatus Bathyarchaeota archaeon]|nr:MAG: UPF0104 family protein [Candidatus Bathyarchaeota archaeon]
MMERRRVLTRTLPLLLLGIFIFILYLFFIDFSKIAEVFRQIDPYIFAASILASILDVMFFTLTWHILLRTLSVKAKFSKSIAYVLIGNLVDIIVPAESMSAEVSKIYLMKRDGEDVGKVTATLVMQRVYGMMLHAVTLVVACIYMIATNYPLPSLVVYFVSVTIGLTMLFLSLIVLACLKKDLACKFLKAALGVAERLVPSRFNIERWSKSVEHVLSTFYSSLSNLAKKPSRMLISILSSTTSWIFCLLVSQTVFISLGYSMPFIIVAVVYSISIIVQYMPAGIPSEAGITEVVMSSLYGMFGVPLSVGAAATILVRLLTVWMRCILGLVALYWRGITTKKQIKEIIGEGD